jgi:hypothetical protein
MALRIGPLVGPVVGPKVGANGDVVPPPPITWNVDASSSKARPLTNAEWDALIADAAETMGAPDSIYLCQDPNTQLTDVNGIAHLAQVGAGHSYAQPIAGWNALGAQLADGTVGSWTSVDAILPNILTASCLVLAYIAYPGATPGNTRNTVTLGTTTNVAASRFNITTGFCSGISVGNAATGTNNQVNRVALVWLRVNRTAGTVTILTDQEVLAPAFNAAMTGKTFRLGGVGAAATIRFPYAARWDGPKAEVSNATIKAISVKAGWSIPW